MNLENGNWKLENRDWEKAKAGSSRRPKGERGSE
jgi:hypothetical protein